MDEAGTSGSRKDEKARIVAGVIVHADEQLMYAEALLKEALFAVPAQFAEGFVFHAEEIMNAKRYRDAWGLTDRVTFLCSVMSIPSRIRMSVPFGLTLANAPIGEPMPGVKPHEQQHLQAFIGRQGCR